MSNEIATKFMLYGVQDWGQSESDRIAAVQRLLEVASFNARAECAPVFGAFFPQAQKPCSGPDGVEAWEWLQNLLKTMPRGKFEREVEHIEKAIAARHATLEASP